jgi:hypothetical protein
MRIRLSALKVVPFAINNGEAPILTWLMAGRAGRRQKKPGSTFLKVTVKNWLRIAIMFS